MCIGIRDEGLLETALENAFASFGGEEFYPSREEKGARLGYELISNHVFVDGNKRNGMYVMLTFLEVNGIYLECTNEEVAEVGFAVVAGEMNTKHCCPGSGSTGFVSSGLLFDYYCEKPQKPCGARLLRFSHKIPQICAIPTKPLCHNGLRFDGLITPTFQALPLVIWRKPLQYLRLREAQRKNE